MAENPRQELESQLESGLMSPEEFDIRSDQLTLEESFALPEGAERSQFFPVISTPDKTAQGGKFLDIGFPGFVEDIVTNVGDIVTSIRLGEETDPDAVSQLAMDVGTGGLGGSAITKAGADVAGFTAGMFVPARKVAPELAQKADDMRTIGKTDEEVFELTGIYTGADNIDKLEIPDGKATIKKPYTGTAKGIQNNIKVKRLPIEEVLDHPALYEAYPEIKDVKITMDADDPTFKSNVGEGKRVVGVYKRDLNEIVINPLVLPSKEQKKQFILHELQHAVQFKEGFALGSNPAKEKKRLDATVDSLVKQRNEAALKKDHYAVQDLNNKINKTMAMSGDKSYRLQAGEVEARLVEQRSGLKPTKNKKYFPGNKEEFGVNLDPNRGLAEDVPRSKQAVVTDFDLRDYSFATQLKAVEPMEVGFNEALMSGKFLKNYDNTVTQEMVKNSSTARTGARGETDLLMTEVPEGTKVGVRLNLNSKIEGMPKGLDKLQTLHKGSYSGKALSYQPFVVVKDVKFNVSQPGRTGIAARIKEIDTPEAKNKFPAMSVDGKYVPNANLLEGNTDDLVEIGFNPGEHHLFIDLTTGQAVKGADEAMVIGDRIYARNVEYWKKSQAPKPIPTKSGVDIPSSVRFKEMNAGGLMLDEYNRAES